MKTNRKRLYALRIWWQRNRSIALRIMLHGVTMIVFVAMYVCLQRWLPVGLAASEFENSVQLLGQVLALVVGVLLVGTTVSLSSYDGADTLSAIHSELGEASAPFFINFFAGGRARHKLDTRDFRRSLLLRPRVEKLLFSPYKSDDELDAGWFVYRPDWDGVWYQVARSPFHHSNRTDRQMWQVQRLHEAVICAYSVLQAVAEFRASGSALLGPEIGTNGTRWFLAALEKHKVDGGFEVPGELTLHEAVTSVSLALSSEHYMQEEFRNHTGNIDWAPIVLTAFQLKYADYVKVLSQLVEKLQLLRWANLVQRYPSKSLPVSKRIGELLWLEKLGNVRRRLAGVRGKIVSAHGAAQYFHNVKISSIPGIGISLFVLFGLLCSWPYLKWSAASEIRTEWFIILYSAAIASLVESSIFLTKLLWRRRNIR